MGGRRTEATAVTDHRNDDELKAADFPADGRLTYRVTEADEMLGIGRTNVYQLMDQGKVRPVRIGHRRLIPWVSLEAFVAELLEAS